jgi:hypothetical protein
MESVFSELLLQEKKNDLLVHGSAGCTDIYGRAAQLQTSMLLLLG